MFKYLLVFLITLSSSVYGYNTKYSFKDFSDQDLSKENVEDLNNSIIRGSCFYQQGEPDQKTFPQGMTGVQFVSCNLDNVLIPDGNTITLCTNKRLKKQNDGHIWIVDKDKKPLEPLRKKDYEDLGLSTLVADIPTEPLEEALIVKTKKDQEESEDADVEAFKIKRKEELKIKDNSEVTQEVKKGK